MDLEQCLDIDTVRSALDSIRAERKQDRREQLRRKHSKSSPNLEFESGSIKRLRSSLDNFQPNVNVNSAVDQKSSDLTAPSTLVSLQSGKFKCFGHKWTICEYACTYFTNPPTHHMLPQPWRKRIAMVEREKGMMFFSSTHDGSSVPHLACYLSGSMVRQRSEYYAVAHIEAEGWHRWLSPEPLSRLFNVQSGKAVRGSRSSLFLH